MNAAQHVAALGSKWGARAVGEQAARQFVEPQTLAEGGDVLGGVHGRSFWLDGVQETLIHTIGLSLRGAQRRGNPEMPA